MTLFQDEYKTVLSSSSLRHVTHLRVTSRNRQFARCHVSTAPPPFTEYTKERTLHRRDRDSGRRHAQTL